MALFGKLVQSMGGDKFSLHHFEAPFGLLQGAQNLLNMKIKVLLEGCQIFS